MVATGRLLQHVWRSGGAPGLRGCLLGLLVALLFGAAYFRPHEDLFGGQDQGAYLNAAVTFARTKALKHVDPLLAAVAEEDRAAFHFRSSRSGLPTLMHALRLERDTSARQVPWFQPGFSLLLALPALFGCPTGCLYVTPLLAMLVGFSLFALSLALWPARRAHVIALLAFLAMPLVVWHGRNARAEIAASYFLVSGVACLAHWIRAGRERKWDAVLAGVCLGLAPLFHIMTAPVLALIVAALIVRIGLGCLRRDYPLYGVLLGASLFGAQSLWITDPYKLSPLISNPYVIACASLLAAVLWSVGRGCRRLPSLSLTGFQRTALGAALVVFGVILVVGIHRLGCSDGRSLFESGRFLRVLGLVDLPGFVHLVRLPLAVVALFGWCCWVFCGRDDALSSGIAVSALLFSLVGGVVSASLGYSSRYMMLYLAPFVAMSLAAAIMACRAGSDAFAVWRIRGVATLVLFSILWAVRVQWPMVAERDYPDYTCFVQRVARPLQGGIVLCESSRVATALKHVAGIDVLAIDTGSCRDYARIETGWQSVMAAFPDRPVFFVSPFDSAPVSEVFDFKACEPFRYEGSRLRSSATKMRDESSPVEKQLFVYRMFPASPRLDSTAPFVRDIPQVSSMGVRRFHDCRPTSPNQKGVRLPSETGEWLRLGDFQGTEGSDRVGLVFVSDSEPRVEGADGGELSVLPLQSPWWLAVGPQTAVEAGIRSLQSKSPVFLVDCWLLSSRPRPLVGWDRNHELKALALDAVSSRWMAQGAAILLPERSPGTMFALLIKLSLAEEAVDPQLRLATRSGVSSTFAADSRAGQLRWFFLNSENCAASTPHWDWVRMAMHPPARVSGTGAARVGVLASACALPLTAPP
ncbi:MAG: hypothetical protein HN341_08175 [Verrucomicrobia bacterium]|nr:hypothetical protein [Verrucomicrobiota bacterium]